MKQVGNFMKQKKRTKNISYYIVAFVLLFLLILDIFFKIYENHKKTVVDQQNRQLNVIATVGTSYLKTYVDEKNLEFQNMFTLKELGNNPIKIKRRVEEIIKLYWNQCPIYLDYLRYFTVKELESISISGLSCVDLSYYEQLALKSNELIIGPFMQVNSNNMGIYLFKGVFNEYGKFGILVGRINLSMVFHNTISNIQLGDAGYLTLSDIDETFSYYGNQDGLYLAPNTPPALTKQSCLKGYSFTKLGNLNLLISARLPFYEIEKPIKITFYLLLSLSIGLLILFSIFTYLLFRFQKKEFAYAMELKLQEQMHQSNRNEVLGLFSRKIAHEYNNLLTPISIYCELLEDELTKESQLEYVHEIKQSSEQCTKLAKELLEYGRNQPKSHTLVQYDSTNLLKDTLKRIKLLLPDKIALHSVLPPEPIYLSGQPLEFVQIVYNLCLNSIHAMAERDYSQHVLKIEYQKENSNAVLKISDTGLGIPKHLQKKIFATQFTTKPDGRGNGLGLAIVSGIVEKYNGRITFESQEGKGTQFSIYFPLSN